MDSNHNIKFHLMTLYLLGKNPIKNQFGLYLAKLLETVELTGNDSCGINEAKKLIKFRCSFITFNRLMSFMGDLFIYRGIPFDECEITFKKDKIKGEAFDMLSPNVEMLIKVSATADAKMAIKIIKDDYE